MLFGKNHYSRDFYLPSRREPLRIVNQEKDLGVIFDDKLSFSIHITDQVNKANRIMGAIRRSFTDLNSDNIRGSLYDHDTPTSGIRRRCMVTPYEKRHSTNRKCAAKGHQTTSKQFFQSYTTVRDLRQLDLPTLRYRHIRGDMIVVFKILKY